MSTTDVRAKVQKLVDKVAREIMGLKQTIRDTEVHVLDHGASVEMLGENIARQGAKIAALGGRMKQVQGSGDDV